MLKKIGIALAVVVVVLVGAVLLVPRFIDWNDYKPEIAAAVREATGRNLTIAGDIEVSVLPGAEFVATDVRFANAEGAEPENMATVARIEGAVALFPLIGGDLVVERLVIQEPVVALRIGEDGQANWTFSPAAQETAASEPAASGEGSPVSDVRLDDVRIVGGVVTFVDARTGQEIEARDIAVAAALPNLSEPLAITGSMTLNGEPVSLEFDVATPADLMAGNRAAVTAMIDSQRLKMSYDGGVQREPVPGLDGTFDLDIPSAGELAAWLDRPLPEGQPDPGPVKAHAVFEADGGAVAIREATLEGESLQAQATGTLDISGDAPRLSLQVESGVLDFDRYLPQPTAAGATADAAPSPPRPQGDRDLLAEISDEPFDLSPLRNGAADVRVSVDGIKAAGYDVGKILFVATLGNGVLNAELQELALYGGGVTGSMNLDATGDTLAMSTSLDVAGVKTGELGAAATGGESPVTGTVSADLQLEGSGASPKALVGSLNGKLAVDLGGLDLGAAAPGAISGLKVDLDLPGIDSSPVLTGSVVYNKERVDFKATLDPLPAVVSGDRFAVDTQVTSKPLTASYAGAVLKEPVTGLDGTFQLSVPSVGRLASWLGTPLGPNQRDPGPLKARAVFAGEGGRVAIEQAVIEGDGLKAEASGSWAKEGDVTKLVLDAKAGVVDLDRYLPKQEGAAASQAANPGREGLLASIPNEPLDLSALRSLEADIDLALDGLKVSGQQIGKMAVAVDVNGGNLTAEIQQLALYGGSVQGRVSLEAGGSAPSYKAALDASNVDLGPALGAASGAEPPLQGSLTARLEAAGSGASPRGMVSATKAEVNGQASELTVAGEPPRRLEQVAFSAGIPGFDSPVNAEGSAVYDGEKVAVAVQADPLNKILGGQRFAVDLSVDSAPLKASYEGAVQQQPVPGLDGRMNVDIPAVGRLLAWLGQPLPSGQPEPGPLAVQAVLAADGATVALKEASIQGKALQASANATYDGSGEKPRIDARLDVQKADLDAYLPASAGGSSAPAQQAKGGGWSTEPLDLGMLSTANGNVEVNLNGVRYHGLDIQRGRVSSKLSNGVLNAGIASLKVAEGTVDGNVAVDGSGNAAAVDYDLTVSGVNARPLLRAFADTNRLSGRTEFNMKGSARGSSQKEMVSNLNGQGELRFFDGAIYGVNLAAVLRQVGTLGIQGGEEQKTDFAELGGTFNIRNGVFENRDLKMLAPLVRLNGGGTSNLPARTIDYRVEAKLVASLQGQGGEEALAGLPVPIQIGGTFDNPTYQVDWKSVFQAAAQDPERLKNMPADLLGAAQELGVNLKGLGGAGGLGDVLKSLPGGGGGANAPSGGSQPSLPLDPLKQLFGGKKSSGGTSGADPTQSGTDTTVAPQNAPATPENAPAEGAPAPQTTESPPAAPEPERKQDPLQQLKGLFGR